MNWQPLEIGGVYRLTSQVVRIQKDCRRDKLYPRGTIVRILREDEHYYGGHHVTTGARRTLYKYHYTVEVIAGPSAGEHVGVSNFICQPVHPLVLLAMEA